MDNVHDLIGPVTPIYDKLPLKKLLLPVHSPEYFLRIYLNIGNRRLT